MKTTNIVLIGVVGLGAVGAYLYMKNKKAQDNLLSGSLPATPPSGTAPSGTAPSGTAPSGTAPSGTAPSGTAPSGTAPSGTAPSGTAPSGTAPSGTAPSGTAPSGTAPSGTPPQNNEVFLPSNNDLKLLDATLLLGKIKKAQLAIVDSKKPFTGRKDYGGYDMFNKFTPEYKAYLSKKDNAPKALKGLIIELHNLGYELNANNNLVKLDPNRDKEKYLKAIGYQFDVIALKEKSKEPFDGRKFTGIGGTNENKPSDWTFEYKMYRMNRDSIPKTLEKLIIDLDNLDYALDTNDNLVKLDPNRNKEWIKVQKLYLSLVNSMSTTPLGLLNQAKVKELASYGYKIDPTTKKLVTI